MVLQGKLEIYLWLSVFVVAKIQFIMHVEKGYKFSKCFNA
jgi:hypothetical protein